MDTMNKDVPYDVIIIGGGPAGLSAALYAARGALKTIVLDKNPAAGALGSTDKIENYPGVNRTKGADLLSLFFQQAKSFGASRVQTQVVGVDFSQDEKQVITAEKVYTGKTVIIATGAMGRTPTIAGEAAFTGRGVSYCAVCDAPFFKGKKAAVAGNIEEILEELDVVAKFADTVYVIPRTITPEQAAMVREYTNVTVIPGRVTEILGTKTVESITIVDTEKNEKTLDVAGVFIFLHGNKPIVDFLYNAVDISEKGCITVDEDMATSVEGVYAAGDVTCKKFRQVVIAAAEGCIAALSADKYINKRKRVRPQWS